MKTRDDYVLREVAGTWIVMPIGKSSVNFNGILSLNETGCFIWKILEKGAKEQEIVDALVREYDVLQSKAQTDVSNFLEKIRAIDCLEDN